MSAVIKRIASFLGIAQTETVLSFRDSKGRYASGATSRTIVEGGTRKVRRCPRTGRFVA